MTAEGVRKAAAAAAAAALAGILGAAAVSLPGSAGPLPALVAQGLPQSGVRHPVTAVLLNFRAWDTLLELAVLLLAALAARSLAPAPGTPPAPESRDPILVAFFRALAPPGIVIAAAVLWVGARAPGGAFQAGSLLGAIAVLASLTAGFRPGPASRPIAAALAAGLSAFGLAAFTTLAVQGTPLRYGDALAASWILGIETAATISIAAALLVLFDACRRGNGPHGEGGGRPPDDQGLGR